MDLEKIKTDLQKEINQKEIKQFKISELEIYHDKNLYIEFEINEYLDEIVFKYDLTNKEIKDLIIIYGYVGVIFKDLIKVADIIEKYLKNAITKSYEEIKRG